MQAPTNPNPAATQTVNGNKLVSETTIHTFSEFSAETQPDRHELDKAERPEI